jgi:hypothetical protein
LEVYYGSTLVGYFTSAGFTNPGTETITGALTLTGGLASVKGITVTGATGLAAVVAQAKTASVAATQTNLINYATPAVAGTYRFSVMVANTAGTNTGSNTVTVVFTNAAGIAITLTVPLDINTFSATWVAAATGSSVSFQGTATFSIDASATAITATSTVSGTTAAFINMVLEQLA